MFYELCEVPAAQMSNISEKAKSEAHCLTEYLAARKLQVRSDVDF